MTGKNSKVTRSNGLTITTDKVMRHRLTPFHIASGLTDTYGHTVSILRRVKSRGTIQVDLFYPTNRDRRRSTTRSGQVRVSEETQILLDKDCLKNDERKRRRGRRRWCCHQTGSIKVNHRYRKTLSKTVVIQRSTDLTE